MSVTGFDRSIGGIGTPPKSNPDGILQSPGVAAKQRCHRQSRERAVDELRNQASYCANVAGRRAPLDGNSRDWQVRWIDQWK
jgi:hypothetical protein